jgi:hypothetical protein
VILACWLARSFYCCPSPPANLDERRLPAVNCCGCGCSPLPKVLVPRVLLSKRFLPPNSGLPLVVPPKKLDCCCWPHSNKLLVFVVVVLPNKLRPAGFAWLPPNKPPPLVLASRQLIVLPKSQHLQLVAELWTYCRIGSWLLRGCCVVVVFSKRPPPAAGCCVVVVLPKRLSHATGCCVLVVLWNRPPPVAGR